PNPLRHPATTNSSAPQPDTGSYRDKFVDPDTAHPEKSRRIMPQAARFRVFAYIYDSRDSNFPYKVLELKPSDADIEWAIAVSNEKSVAPDGKTLTPNRPGAKTLSTKASSPPTNCKDGTKPNLAWLMLEKDANGKPTGRLHVIGNE